ncbi:Alanine dehydrogenase [compost metagenome]
MTIAYALELANKGIEAVRSSLPLQKGVNTHNGKLTYEPVAAAVGLPYSPLADWLDSIPYERLQ